MHYCLDWIFRCDLGTVLQKRRVVKCELICNNCSSHFLPVVNAPWRTWKVLFRSLPLFCSVAMLQFEDQIWQPLCRFFFLWWSYFCRFYWLKLLGWSTAPESSTVIISGRLRWCTIKYSLICVSQSEQRVASKFSLQLFQFDVFQGLTVDLPAFTRWKGMPTLLM